MTDEKNKNFLMEYEEEDKHIVVYDKKENKLAILYTIEDVADWLKKHTTLQENI